MKMGKVLMMGKARLSAMALTWVVAATLALPGCAWIDTQQRAKGYRPTPGSMADWKPVSNHDEMLWLALPPQQGSSEAQGLRAVWIAADDPAAPAVLYLHGTFRNLTLNQPKIAAIHAAGFSVLAIDYRGWGESSKVLPSEQSIMDDAERAWIEFARRAPDVRSRVIFGHSMGSGAAVELALRHRDPLAYGALVVESGMTSMPDLVRDIHALGFVAAPFVTQQFASIDKIGRIEAPKWFLSGSADKTVPSRQTQQLYDAAAAPKQIDIFEGGSHSGLHAEFEQRYQAVWHEVAASLQAGHTAAAASPKPQP
jgi:uncharacterized protein